MAKLGLARHRYTVAILCWFYVVISLLMHIYCVFDTFVGGVFVISSINLAIGCFGLYSLYKENATLMKSYGIIIAIITALEMLEVLGLLILTLLRKTFLDLFLKQAMDTYYNNEDDRELMDSLQRELKCCGRQSYKDWTIQPFSCYKTADCLDYYDDGCVAALSPIISWVLLAVGVVCVASILFHICAVVSAFNLARVYNRQPILPSIKHNLIPAKK